MKIKGPAGVKVKPCLRNSRLEVKVKWDSETRPFDSVKTPFTAYFEPRARNWHFDSEDGDDPVIRRGDALGEMLYSITDKLGKIKVYT
jgi:hypothetical protein